MGDFEEDTRIEAHGDGLYRASLHRDWEIWGPNGGYLAALALRAAGAEAAIARPVSFSCHFLRIARFDEVEMRVHVLRRGRRAESLRVTMEQDGRPVIEAQLRTAEAGPGLEHDFVEVPDVPGPEGLPNLDDLVPEDAERNPFWKNFDVRRPTPPPDDWEKREARPPSWREWYRFRPAASFGDPWVDAGRIVLILDTITWPAAVGPHPDSAYIAPNLDLSVWFHTADFGSEWLLADHHAPLAADGLIGVHGRVWSASRQLLASGGAQLLCSPMPSQAE